MNSILYYILYSVLWLISLLPRQVLYFFSRLIYFFVYYISAYRKTIVFKNLRNSFPEKTEAEIRKIARGFYGHFSNLMVESIMSLTLSRKEHLRRFSYKNPELLEEIYAAGKSIILVLPHYGNWEWIVNMECISSFHFLAIYKPLHSSAMDRLFIKLRERFGGETVPMKQSLRRIMKAVNDKEQTITFFLYDQRPRKNEMHHWLNFMNQDTPVLLGAEKIARKTGQTVVFFKTTRIKRGYYENEFIKMTDDPAGLPMYELTDSFFRIVEDMLNKTPEYWLWTHDRWKFKRN